jgi:hypothetical protein
MKTLFFVLITLVLLVSNPVKSQDTASTVSNTERIIDKYIDKTADALQSLAETLKVPAEHVYGILVKQSVTVGIVESFLFGFGLVFFLFSLWLGYKDEWDGGLPIILTIISSIILVVGVFVFAFEGLPRMLNPEYYAIQKILDVLQ